MTFVGTHNSYAVGGEVADNQGWNITQQLVSFFFAEWILEGRMRSGAGSVGEQRRRLRRRH